MEFFGHFITPAAPVGPWCVQVAIHANYYNGDIMLAIHAAHISMYCHCCYYCLAKQTLSVIAPANTFCAANGLFRFDNYVEVLEKWRRAATAHCTGRSVHTRHLWRLFPFPLFSFHVTLLVQTLGINQLSETVYSTQFIQ